MNDYSGIGSEVREDWGMNQNDSSRGLLLLLFLFVCDPLGSQLRGDVEQQAIWVAGEEGYHTYRIPALIETPNGSLLAFCEGRREGRSDAGNIDLLLKRSIDGGKTWGRVDRVWDDGSNTCGNPCPVVDRATGTIWLLLTHNLGEDRESAIVGGTSVGTRTVWVTSSQDDGVSWKRPHEITVTTKESGWSWYATGPGVGIQLEQGPQAGRLVIPCDHKVLGSRKLFSHVIYSDDHGLSWRLGGRVPDDQTNECQVVELEDGRLLLNMRHYDRERGTRALSYSEDGGMSWSGNFFHPELIEPVCQASLVRGTIDEEPVILFANPADRRKRVRMTVRASLDEGRTWPLAQVLHEGPAAYSSLALLRSGEVVCFYERGERSSYERMMIARFSLTDLVPEK